MKCNSEFNLQLQKMLCWGWGLVLKLQAAFEVIWSLCINLIILPNCLPGSAQIKYSCLWKVSKLAFCWKVSASHFVLIPHWQIPCPLRIYFPWHVTHQVAEKSWHFKGVISGKRRRVGHLRGETHEARIVCCSICRRGSIPRGGWQHLLPRFSGYH